VQFIYRVRGQLASACGAQQSRCRRLPSGCLFDRSKQIKLPRCHSDPVSRVLASATASEQKIGELDRLMEDGGDHVMDSSVHCIVCYSSVIPSLNMRACITVPFCPGQVLSISCYVDT